MKHMDFIDTTLGHDLSFSNPNVAVRVNHKSLVICT